MSLVYSGGETRIKTNVLHYRTDVMSKKGAGLRTLK